MGKTGKTLGSKENKTSEQKQAERQERKLQKAKQELKEVRAALKKTRENAKAAKLKLRRVRGAQAVKRAVKANKKTVQRLARDVQKRGKNVMPVQVQQVVVESTNPQDAAALVAKEAEELLFFARALCAPPADTEAKTKADTEAKTEAKTEAETEAETEADAKTELAFESFQRFRALLTNHKQEVINQHRADLEAFKSMFTELFTNTQRMQALTKLQAKLSSTFRSKLDGGFLRVEYADHAEFVKLTLDGMARSVVHEYVDHSYLTGQLDRMLPTCEKHYIVRQAELQLAKNTTETRAPSGDREGLWFAIGMQVVSFVTQHSVRHFDNGIQSMITEQLANFSAEFAKAVGDWWAAGTTVVAASTAGTTLALAGTAGAAAAAAAAVPLGIGYIVYQAVKGYGKLHKFNAVWSAANVYLYYKFAREVLKRVVLPNLSALSTRVWDNKGKALSRFVSNYWQAGACQMLLNWALTHNPAFVNTLHTALGATTTPHVLLLTSSLSTAVLRWGTQFWYDTFERNQTQAQRAASANIRAAQDAYETAQKADVATLTARVEKVQEDATMTSLEKWQAFAKIKAHEEREGLVRRQEMDARARLERGWIRRAFRFTFNVGEFAHKRSFLPHLALSYLSSWMWNSARTSYREWGMDTSSEPGSAASQRQGFTCVSVNEILWCGEEEPLYINEIRDAAWRCSDDQLNIGAYLHGADDPAVKKMCENVRNICERLQRDTPWDWRDPLTALIGNTADVVAGAADATNNTKVVGAVRRIVSGVRFLSGGTIEIPHENVPIYIGQALETYKHFRNHRLTSPLRNAFVSVSHTEMNQLRDFNTRFNVRGENFEFYKVWDGAMTLETKLNETECLTNKEQLQSCIGDYNALQNMMLSLNTTSLNQMRIMMQDNATKAPTLWERLNDVWYSEVLSTAWNFINRLVGNTQALDAPVRESASALTSRRTAESQVQNFVDNHLLHYNDRVTSLQRILDTGTTIDGIEDFLTNPLRVPTPAQAQGAARQLIQALDRVTSVDGFATRPYLVARIAQIRNLFTLHDDGVPRLAQIALTGLAPEQAKDFVYRLANFDLETRSLLARSFHEMDTDLAVYLSPEDRDYLRQGYAKASTEFQPFVSDAQCNKNIPESPGHGYSRGATGKQLAYPGNILRRMVWKAQDGPRLKEFTGVKLDAWASFGGTAENPPIQVEFLNEEDFSMLDQLGNTKKEQTEQDAQNEALGNKPDFATEAARQDRPRANPNSDDFDQRNTPVPPPTHPIGAPLGPFGALSWMPLSADAAPGAVLPLRVHYRLAEHDDDDDDDTC